MFSFFAKRPLTTVLVASAAMFLINLGAPALWDVDEAIFSQTAVEMFDRGDWVVPYYNGEVFPDKPPFMYWMMMTAFAALGKTELAARVWSALFGIGTVAITYLLARRLFARQIAFWAALILASSLNFTLIARAATPDSMLTFFSTLALAIVVWRSTYPYARTEAGADSLPDEMFWLPDIGPDEVSWSTYAAVYVAMSVGVLVKGPVAIVLPTCVLGLFFLLTRTNSDAQRSWWTWLKDTLNPAAVLATAWKMRPLTASAILLSIAGPWYALVGYRTDGAWLSTFFGIHNVGRFLQPMENHRGPVYYYLIAVLIGMFPWSIFAAPTALQALRRIRDWHTWRTPYLLLASWAAVWIGFFTLAGTKLPSYIIPAYPALAIILAGFVHSWLAETESIDRRWIRGALGLLAVIGCGVVLGVPAAARIYFEKDPLLGLFGFAPLAGGFFALILNEQKMSRSAGAALAVSAVAFSLGLFGFAAVRVDRFQTSEPLSHIIREHASTNRPTIAQYQFARPSMVYYAGHRIEPMLSGNQVRHFFETHPQDAFLVTTDDRLPEIQTGVPGDVQVLEERRIFGKRGNVVLLGRNLEEHGPMQAGAAHRRRR